MEVARNNKKNLKSMITKVLRGLQFLAPSGAHSRRVCYLSDIDEEEKENATKVPEDVKEGHFAVIAMHGEETKRFVVELDYLTDPDFLRLLEQAKEEYGFEQKGALAVPCTPQELQQIIQNRLRN
ncbi:auxin-responsive protein SAUR71 [Cajanus cajan]|uniref:Auxin-induced protein 6B n=1 Tax=Cajanus cajan TaxID=3821 RepID=A0A151TV19_CAJCA|nr:auxin-responsive protein SAUR71 [Cajanus cajan]KYP70897.1 Auxin-induced protein 6B [Cajanus cajan]